MIVIVMVMVAGVVQHPPAGLVPVDAFLWNDDDVEDMVEEGKLKRCSYATAVERQSHNTRLPPRQVHVHLLRQQRRREGSRAHQPQVSARRLLVLCCDCNAQLDSSTAAFPWTN